MYVFIQSEPGLFTVGFYDPASKWHADSDHSDRAAAATRVHYLNGNPAPMGGDAVPEFLAKYGTPDPRAALVRPVPLVIQWINADAFYAIEGYRLARLKQWSQTLNDPKSMTFDQRRDLANFIDLVISDAVELDLPSNPN